MKEFDEEIKDLVNEHPTFSKDEAFVFWFVNYQLNDENRAEDSLTGVSGDKGIDALWINDEAQTVNILQAKLREVWGKHSELRNDVLALLDLVDIFWDDVIKNSYFKGLDPKIVKKLNSAIERVKKRKYKINLYFITTGKISSQLRKEVKHKQRTRNGLDDYGIYDHTELLSVWGDWKEAVAPAVPDYHLPIETGNFQNSIINKTDSQRDIDTWIVTVTSKNIGNMFKNIGKVLFAKNIRGFLGPLTPINKAMIETIKQKPEDFWYYNNGITMVCDDCKETRSGGKTELHVVRPQIINGLQTTRTLTMGFHPKAHVLLKVIKIPRKGDYGYAGYHELVNNIVKATNWQNKITYEDLVSNDLFQIDLERKFRSLKYQYIRKRQKKSEARDEAVGWSPHFKIKKDDLARATAACELGPEVVRMGKEALFDQDRYYKRVFAKTDPSFYLSCVHVWKFLEHHRKNNVPIRYYSGDAKWLVVHFIWNGLENTIDSGEGARRFRIAWLKKSDSYIDDIMAKMIYLGFKMTKTFYKRNRKIKGRGELAERDFYKLSNLWKNFSRYSKTKNKREWRKFKKLVKDFGKELKAVELT